MGVIFDWIVNRMNERIEEQQLYEKQLEAQKKELKKENSNFSSYEPELKIDWKSINKHWEEERKKDLEEERIRKAKEHWGWETEWQKQLYESKELQNRIFKEYVSAPVYTPSAKTANDKRIEKALDEMKMDEVREHKQKMERLHAEGRVLTEKYIRINEKMMNRSYR